LTSALCLQEFRAGFGDIFGKKLALRGFIGTCFFLRSSP
jgi:hypothetical protein